MIGATPIIHALGGGPLRLVSAGALSGGLALTRASAALAAGADGATMLSYAANAPRFQGAAQRLLVEGARTNSIRNPRGEGAVVGSPGTVPTNWTITPVSGTARSIVGTGTDAAGLPYVDIRFSGTATASTWHVVQPETTAIAATLGDVWTTSAWVQLVGGSTAGITAFRLRTTERIPGTGSTSETLFTPTTTRQRVSSTRVLSDSTVSGVTPYFLFSISSGSACDFTLRISGVQTELGGFASTPVLPAAGTPAASTRAADLPVFALNAARSAAGTLVGTFMLPSVGTASADQQGLLVLDDGTDSNRFGLRKPGGAAALQPFRSASGTLTSGSSIQTMAPGVAYRVALAWDASGVVACCNGGTVASLAGALPAVNRLLVGHGASTLGQGAFGEVGPLDLHPTRLPDATLQALTLN